MKTIAQKLAASTQPRMTTQLVRFATYDFATRQVSYKNEGSVQWSVTWANGTTRTFTDSDKQEAQRLIEDVELSLLCDRSEVAGYELIILVNSTHMFTLWHKKS